ncbi:MAG: NAD(P)-dependent oxidoreductase [Candidatus Gastranaerophilales bacterium]|nr:NAD(P)-dependent oxidoreductase [Candidatus Gastranaerophilales bacterium]
MDKKNVLIFGATGLIGSYLTDYLRDMYNVFAVGNRSNFTVKYDDVSYYKCSIENKEDFEKLPKNIDVVVMLAGILPANMETYVPEKYFQVNTLGLLNVLEYCKQTGVKQIIYTQSHSDVKGLWGKGVIDAYVEYSLDYNNDHTVYVISKVAGVELIKHYHELCGLKYVILRCPNIYAWHPSTSYFVDGKKTIIAYRYFIKRAMESLPIEVYGDENSCRDVVYIKDLNQLVEKSISKEISSAFYNVSNGKAISIKEQVQDIIDVFSPKDNPSQIIYRPEIKVSNLNYQYDITNAKTELDYEPKYFHKEMLIDMKEEMSKNRFNF